MDMNSKSINSLIEASADAYAEDLRTYQLSPRGSSNGFTEANIPLAIAKQVARQEAGLGWRSYVEIPFVNPSVKQSIKKRNLPSRLDLALLGDSSICLFECKQFRNTSTGDENTELAPTYEG